MHVAARIRGADGPCAVHKKAATLIREHPKVVVSMKTHAIGLLPLAATPLAATKLESWPTCTATGCRNASGSLQQN